MTAGIAAAEAFTAEVIDHSERWRTERADMIVRHRQSETAARKADRADLYALEIEAEARGERLPMLLPSGVADSTERLWMAQRHALTRLDVRFDASRPRPSLPTWIWLQRVKIWRSPGQLASTVLIGVARCGRGVRYRSWRGNGWVRIEGCWQRR